MRLPSELKIRLIINIDGRSSVLSLEDFQAFIESGKYIELAEGIKQLEILKSHIREYQSDSGKKRMEWVEQGVVGIFEGNRVYDNDTEGLKSLLYNIGILPVVCKVEWSLLSVEEKEQMKPWLVNQADRACFTPKKAWRVETDQLRSYEEWCKRISLIEQVEEWKRQKLNNDELSDEWKRVKDNLLNSPLSRDLLQCDYGTINYTPTKPILKGIDLYQEYGQVALFKYGSVDMSELEVYMAKGLLTKSEVLNYRKIVDVRLKYTIMESYKEERKNLYLQDRQRYLSVLNRI